MNSKGTYLRVKHEFPPFYSSDSTILILGSFPSVKSRKQQFYYGHPQNRFWKVLAAVKKDAVPESLEEKKQFLLRYKIALWDVIEECDIIGSRDSSIRNVVPTKLDHVLGKAPIDFIYVNGGTAKRLYDRYQKNEVKKDGILLPSTSPANAAWTLDRLIQAWSGINDTNERKDEAQ